MAKLPISRLLEASKLLQTNAGRELQELISFVNELADKTVGALRQGLTFDDNFNSMTSIVSLKHDVEQRVNSNGRQIYGILPIRCISTTTAVTSLVWYMNQANELVVKAQFVGAPTDPVDTTLLILFV